MAMHHICLVALLLLGVGADVSVKAPETAAQAGDASALLQNEDAGEEAETLSADESSQEEEDDEDDDDDDDGEGEEGEDASLLQGATDAAGEDAVEDVAAQEGDAEDADDKDDEDDVDEDDEDDVEQTSEALLAQLDENKDGKLSLEELTKGQSDQAEITHMKEAIKKVDLDADALVNIEELPKLRALAEADDNEEGDDDDDEGGEEGEDASLLQGASDAGGEDAEEVAAAADAKVDNKVDAKVDANGDAKVEDDEEDEDDEEEDDEDAEAEDDVEDEHDKTPEALMTQYDTSKDGKLSLEELTLGESDEAEVKNIKDALKKVDADADGFVNMEELPKFVSQMKPLDDM